MRFPSTFLTLPLAACLTLALAGCGNDDHHDGSGDRFAADIRRTSYGVPHIKADNDAGLGFGIAWAYAQDNACLLANTVATVNGERSKYWGAEARSTLGELDNLQSDLFYKLVNSHEAVEQAWAAQPARERATIEGYVAGYNRYLNETGRGKLPAECRDGAWVRPITPQDVMRIVRSYAVDNGLNLFAAGLVAAAPPGAGNQPASALSADSLRRQRLRAGSNGVALGRDVSANGRGMVLSNPHFPWEGSLRMYQLHLTIPGQLDAMGVSLGGLPLIGIGFNKELAWTHTNNTSIHFTLHQLELDPVDPTRYMLDGVSQPMTRRTVAVEAKQADGSLATRRHDFYSTPFGPVVLLENLPWNRQVAYAVNDPNLMNHRLLQQWGAMSRAASLAELRDAVDRIVGLPWVNTLAADRHGRALYMDVSVVPKVSAARQAACLVAGFEPHASIGILVMKASSGCRPEDDPAAPQPGIFAGAALPRLERTDFVQNSNDSAWMTNPAAPLSGFPDIVSIAGTELAGRTRIGLAQLQGRRGISLQHLQDMVTNNRVFYAEQVMDDLLGLCGDGPECASLRAWDRSANLDAGIGFGYFMNLWDAIRAQPGLWSVPFDPSDPVNTPRGLNVADPGVRTQLRAALAEAVRLARGQGWGPDTRWGQMHGVERGPTWIGLHGAPEEYGVYNLMSSQVAGNGKRIVWHGTSYLQTVTFDDKGPVAYGLLAYGQSADPLSPHDADQTEMFARKQWSRLPFSEEEIAADPAYRSVKVGGK